ARWLVSTKIAALPLPAHCIHFGRKTLSQKEPACAGGFADSAEVPPIWKATRPSRIGWTATPAEARGIERYSKGEGASMLARREKRSLTHNVCKACCLGQMPAACSPVIDRRGEHHEQ